MRLTCIALATLAVFFGTDAAAVPVTENNNVIRLPLVRNENGQLAHLKRGMLEKRADKQALYNAVGREYMVEIGVGTPAQKFNLTLDTGRYNNKNNNNGKGVTLVMQNWIVPNCGFHQQVAHQHNVLMSDSMQAVLLHIKSSLSLFQLNMALVKPKVSMALILLLLAMPKSTNKKWLLYLLPKTFSAWLIVENNPMASWDLAIQA